MRKNISIFLLSFFLILSTAFSVQADTKPCPSIFPSIFDSIKDYQLRACLSSGGLCETGLLAWYETTWTDDATVTDLAATGTHDAIPPVSIYLSSSYGTLATPITSVGDFEQDFSFRMDAIGTLEVLFGGADSTEGYFGVDASGNPFVYIGAALDTFTDFTLVADTTYACKLKRATTTTTLTVNGTSQAHTTLTSDFVVEFFGGYGTGTTSPFTGNQWNHVIKDSTGTEVLNNYLASGASSTVSPGMVGPDIAWTGLTVPDDWTTDDPRFGHSWNGAPGYSVDVYGLELLSETVIANQNGGVGNLTATGWTVVSDGTSGSGIRPKMALACAVGSTCKINITHTINSGSPKWSVYNGGDYEISNQLVSDLDDLTFVVGGSGVFIAYDGTLTFDLSAVVSIKQLYAGYIPAASEDEDETLDIYGNALTHPGSALQNMTVEGWMADLDGTEELPLAHLVGTESVTTSTGTSTVSVAAGKLTFTAGTVGYVLLDDGTELIFQSFYDSEQITVYDVRATGTPHHGTFTGATVGVGGQWSAEIDGAKSWLAHNGGSVDGVNIIPGKEDSTEDAVGNTKTFTRPYSDSPEGAFIWNAPLTAEVWAADNDNQLINATTGAAEDFDPYDFVEPDPATFLMGPDGAVLLEDEQTGDCLTETTDYLGL